MLPDKIAELELLIPATSSTNKILQIEYIIVPHYCYEEFQHNIDTDDAGWYKPYSRKTVRLNLTSFSLLKGD